MLSAQLQEALSRWFQILTFFVSSPNSADPAVLLPELNAMVEYFTSSDAESFSPDAHTPLIELFCDSFMCATDPILIDRFLTLISFQADCDRFATDAFFAKLLLCLEDPSLAPPANATLRTLILCPAFFDLRPIAVWVEIAPHVDDVRAQAAVLSAVAARWRDIPENCLAPIAAQLLLCLATDDACIVRSSALSLERVIGAAKAGPRPFSEVRAVVCPAIPELFDLIARWCFSEVYSLLQCCLYYDIGCDFLNATDQIGRVRELLGRALQQRNSSEVANALRFIGFLVSELHYDMPFELFQIAVWAASEGTYTVKHAAAELICHRVERFDVPDEFDLQTFAVLLDLVLAPAMDIIDTLLDCVRAALWRSEVGDGVAHFLIHEWPEFDSFDAALTDIEERIDADRADKVHEAVDDIRHMVQKQFPRPYERVYADDSE
jgi:hypothetical protein